MAKMVVNSVSPVVAAVMLYWTISGVGLAEKMASVFVSILQ
jgi:hypothetical protein